MGKNMKKKVKLKTAISISVSSLLLVTSSAQSATIDCSAFKKWVSGGTYTAGAKVESQQQVFDHTGCVNGHRDSAAEAKIWAHQ